MLETLNLMSFGFLLGMLITIPIVTIWEKWTRFTAKRKAQKKTNS